MEKKIEIIDVLRGFAALTVAFLHAREIAWSGIKASWLANGLTFNPVVLLGYMTTPIVWGSIGVPIFFVLSGYCIHRSHALRLQKNPTYKIDSKDYLKRRFFRIYPILIAALIFTYLIDLASHHYAPENPRLGMHDAWTFFVNVAALQGVAGNTFGSNGALWTLSIEIQLYVFYLLLFPFRRRYGIGATVVLASAITFISSILADPQKTSYFAPYLISWCIGAYIAEPRSAIDLKRYSQRRSILASFFLIGMGCVIYFKSSHVAFILWSLGFGVILPVLLSKNWEKRILARMLAVIGNFSYSLYIIHVPVLVFLSSYFFKGEKPDSILYSFLFLLVTVVAGYLFYLAAERPAIEFLKRLSKPSRA